MRGTEMLTSLHRVTQLGNDGMGIGTETLLISEPVLSFYKARFWGLEEVRSDAMMSSIL